MVYKFVDDQGAYLTALITYYGFVSLFPLLLLLVTALGYALQGNPSLQQRVLDSALAQFPVIGDQIGTNIHSFHGSVFGLVIGILGSLSYGSSVRAGAIIITLVLNVALFTTAFRVLTARPVTIAQVRVGAVACAVIWQMLQWAGTFLLGSTLKGATATYGLFGIVLGLLTWIYLGAVTFVICAEFNVVRVQRLWPRSLLTPFTDNVDLTPGDRRAYTSYAETERHKGFENVDVDFDGPPAQDAG